MWSNYTKTFVFRDCFDDVIVDANIAAIQNLLSVKQDDKSDGVFIVTDLLSVQVATSIEVYKTEDDGTWNIVFFSENKEICNVSFQHYKEIQLCFEIEEEINTENILIHYCTIKGFKEYQM